jgi:hypothetical protein
MHRVYSGKYKKLQFVVNKKKLPGLEKERSFLNLSCFCNYVIYMTYRTTRLKLLCYRSIVFWINVNYAKVDMRVEQTYKSAKYRETAQTILNEVSLVVNKAAGTADKVERRELYLKAMRMSNEAYNLLGKARKFDENTPLEKYRRKPA